MLKPRVYLDTTVPSALLDERTPERLALTKGFWVLARDQYELLISELVVQEIENTPDDERRSRLLEAVRGLESLSGGEEAGALAGEYVAAGIFPVGYTSDALHVAIAVVHRVPILASWNFEHLVKRRTRLEVNYLSERLGYPTLDIVSPAEL